MPTKKEQKQAKDLAAVLEKIATWPEDRAAIGRRLHDLILETVPDLNPRLWYGMPGYAKSGPVLVYFRTDKYMTFGKTESSEFAVKPGATDQLMPAAYFFAELDEATEARIAEIVKQAVG